MDTPPHPVPPDPERLDTLRGDAKRLAAVRRTGLLDTPPEESFDRLTRLAVRLTGAPVSFLSLVDAQRDFYKSAYGLGEPLASTRQLEGTTFCHYAIVGDRPLVLDDVTQLPVFRDVPTVQSLGVRAYAGVPLVTSDGQVLGSFCAVDFKAKHWSAQDIEVLTELGQSAMREIELRRAVHEAQATNERLREEIRKVETLNQRLEEMATTDTLTRLRNRRAFDAALLQELSVADRRVSPMSLLMVDADHFKRINDTHGHPAGDKVLQRLARLLEEAARTGDVVARIGGEEFAVLLPDTDAAGALRVAQRMRQAVAEAGWDVGAVTVSIGAATRAAAETAASLKSRADRALYSAKQSGRNRVTEADATAG